MEEPRQHSKEPWGAGDPVDLSPHDVTSLRDGSAEFGVVLTLVDYARASLCVNACTGIDNKDLEGCCVSDDIEELIKERDAVADVGATMIKELNRINAEKTCLLEALQDIKTQGHQDTCDSRRISHTVPCTCHIAIVNAALA